MGTYSLSPALCGALSPVAPPLAVWCRVPLPPPSVAEIKHCNPVSTWSILEAIDTAPFDPFGWPHRGVMQMAYSHASPLLEALIL